MSVREVIDAIVADSMERTKQPGVLVQVTGPAGDHTAAYGKIAKSFPSGLFTKARPLGTDDHFRMGSITKSFVALATFRQIDAGKIALYHPLERYVPGIPNGNVITIADLLSMRSGVYSYTDDLLVKARLLLLPNLAYSTEQALDLVRRKGSQFAPNTRFAYTNSNALLIGAALEAVTGRKIADIVTDDVIRPLGLTHTAWPTGTALPGPAASTLQVHPGLSGAAGALTTTLADLTRFLKAVWRGELLSDDSAEDWTQTFWGYASQKPGLTSSAGYGYFLTQFGEWIGHNGGIPGFTTAALVNADNGATVVIAENTSNGEATSLACTIGAELYPGSLAEPEYSQGLYAA